MTINAPKSNTKIYYRKGKCEVKLENNVERAKYSLNGLTYAALRDVGKFICKKFRENYDAEFQKRTGKGRLAVQYWARKKSLDLQVGFKSKRGFWASFQELGTTIQVVLGLLQKAVEENTDQIVKIEAQYLSALESNNPESEIPVEDEEQGDSES